MKHITRYEKIVAVNRFLNLLNDSLRLHWYMTPEETYAFLSMEGNIVISKDESFNGEKIIFNINW